MVLCSRHPESTLDSRKRCLACRREYGGRIRQERGEYIRAQKREWRKATPRVAYVGKICERHPELGGRRNPEGTCLSCARAASSRYQKAKREKEKAIRAQEKTQHLVLHRDEIDARRKEAIRKSKQKYKEENRDKTAEIQARRRARKLNATPTWANDFFIAEAYHLAQLRGMSSGFEWHVDHIIPLQSKLVCGLHCEFNLQVIPGIENVKKGNKLVAWVG